MDEQKRCEWSGQDPLYIAYHDEDWGVPVHDDRLLFEMLILEGAQAGLSWITILKRRAGYKAVFDNFDVQKVARYDEIKQKELLSDSRIIRNRLKVSSAIRNARAFITVQEEFGSFDRYLWQYVSSEPIQNKWQSLSELPAETPLSNTLSKDLKKRGFNFVGPTMCYAYMQSVGLVNDHVVGCFRHAEVAQIR